MPAASFLPRFSTVTWSQMSKIRSAWCSTSSTPVPPRPIASDQRAEPRDLVGRQAGGRLVQQQEGRAQHQRAGDLHEAQLAVLQPVGAHRGERLQPDDRQRQHRRVAQHGFVAPVARQRQQRFDERAVAVDGAADHDVLQHRGLADDARGLEGAGDPHVRAPVAREQPAATAPFSRTAPACGA